MGECERRREMRICADRILRGLCSWELRHTAIQVGAGRLGDWRFMSTRCGAMKSSAITARGRKTKKDLEKTRINPSRYTGLMREAARLFIMSENRIATWKFRRTILLCNLGSWFRSGGNTTRIGNMFRMWQLMYLDWCR